MIKKKLNILLLLSLVLLFISLLGTTSLAFEPTKNELKNFFWNYAYYFYGNTIDAETNATNLVNNLDDSKLDEWLGYISRYQGRYVLSASGGKIYYWCYTGNDTNLQNHHATYLNGYDTDSIQINNSYLTAWIWIYTLNTNTFANYQTSSSIPITYIYNTSASQRQNWFYTDTNVYNYSNGQYTSIKWNLGYMTPQGLFDGPYRDSSFEFIINSDVFTGTAKIYGDTSNTEYYLLPYNSNLVRLGALYDIDNLESVIKRKYRYNQANRDFALINEYQSNINDTNFFLYDEDYLQVYEYYQPDTTEFIIFTANDSLFNQIVIPIYFTTRNTNVVGGYINLDNTFSGDYYNNYNNDTNTDKIIDNINNDNDVDSVLNEFISGDAEDIANKFGFRLFNQEYYNFIYNTIVSITDVLTDDTDVYFDYSMHGETPTRIYASSFTTPNGALKTFLSTFLISCTVYAFYKYIADLLELISTGNILEALDEFKVDRNIFKM